MLRSCGLERHNLVCEGGEGLVGRGEEGLLPASVKAGADMARARLVSQASGMVFNG